MSKKNKLRERFYKEPPPKDFTWDELETMLVSLGFVKTPGIGSRVKFIYEPLNFPISIHRPHPQNILKQYSIKQIKEALDELKTLLGN